MILDDFMMLGTTVPEPDSTGEIGVCSAGYSAELRQLVRVYPLEWRSIPKRWHVYRVPLERDPRDSRAESWQVRGRPANDQFLEVGASNAKKSRADLAKLVVPSIQEANARRLSLAIVQPLDVPEPHFRENTASQDPPEIALFEAHRSASPSGSKTFPFQPRLKFRDEGGAHDLQIRDWGGYEFMRKHPGRRDLNYHLKPESSLLVGNMSNQRTAWLVISVLNGLRDPDAPLLDVFGGGS